MLTSAGLGRGTFPNPLSQVIPAKAGIHYEEEVRAK